MGADAHFITLTFMALAAYHKKKAFPGFTAMKNLQLDCPSGTCEGWLNGYCSLTDENDVFFQCSNKLNPDPNQRCEQPTIASKRPGKCDACKEPIATGDLITTTWERKWIHIRCAHLDIRPADVFSLCLRCSANIMTKADASPASNGGISGFIHLRCMKKRRLSVSEASDTDRSASQESTA
jgi:hypothetical protein